MVIKRDMFIQDIFNELDLDRDLCKEKVSFNELFDSLQILGLIAIVDSKYGITLTSEELEELSNLDNLFEFINKKKYPNAVV